MTFIALCNNTLKIRFEDSKKFKTFGVATPRESAQLGIAD